MKRFWNLALLVVVMCMLCSCGGMLGDGRMQAWKDVRVEEEKTEQELLKTKSVELAVKNNDSKKQNPTLKVTTQDSAGHPVIIEMDLQPVFAEVADKNEKQGTYGLDMSNTEIPQGEFAEGMEATGGAVTEVANSPSALIGTSGYFTKEVINAFGGGGTEIKAETVSVSDSFKQLENHATGNDNSASLVTAPDTEIEPDIFGVE